eukprot:3263927-Pyramimonas_sp.AAC.1
MERDQATENGKPKMQLFFNITRGETLTELVIRRDSQIFQAEPLGLALPDDIKARYYEEDSQLTGQMRVNLRTLMAGDLSSSSVWKFPSAARRDGQERVAQDHSALDEDLRSHRKTR